MTAAEMLDVYARVFPQSPRPTPRAGLPPRGHVPGALATFHAAAAVIPEVLDRYLRFKALDAIAPDRGYVTFCRDRQGSPAWAYAASDAGRDDPPVYQRTAARGSFTRYGDSLAAFLDFAAMWQFFHGMSFTVEHPENLRPALSADSRYHLAASLVAGGSVEECSAYDFDGGVCCIFPRQDTSYLGFSNRSAVGRLEASLGVVLPIPGPSDDT